MKVYVGRCQRLSAAWCVPVGSSRRSLEGMERKLENSGSLRTVPSRKKKYYSVVEKIDESYIFIYLKQHMKSYKNKNL